MSELPDAWTWSTLGELCAKPQYGWTTSASDNKAEYKLLRTTDISRRALDWEDVPFVSDVPEYPDAYKVCEGDIFVSRAGARVGVSVLIEATPPKALFASYLIRMRPLVAETAPYLRYFLQSSEYWAQIAESRLGIAQPNVNAVKLSQIRVPLPPPAEQRRIVAEIEKQFTRLAAAETIVSATKRKVLALWAKMIGRIFETTPESEWRNLELLIADGPQNGLYKPAQDYGEGVPIVRIDDISSSGDIRSREDLRLLSVTDEELRRYELRENDVLINRVNSMSHLGKSAVVPHSLCPAVFESNMMRLRLTPDIVPMWVTCYLNSRNGRRRLAANAKQAVNQASINQKDVCNTSIPCPSIDVQDSKLEYLSDVDSIFRATVAAAELLARRASRLRQAILAKAFSGQLVPQDANDEPASLLLDRIRANRQRSTNVSGKPRRTPKRTLEPALQSR